ncbi:MAG: glycosyltransferase family 39 protein [Thermoanaerobaculia bacterium]|nr:glycosyltransferase family 39 protein [Thermoanaerobaculia bacterium]
MIDAMSRQDPRVVARSRLEFIALGGLTLAALALRLHDLDRFPLWVDEGATWWYARLIAEGRLMEGIRLEPTPPLYYLLVVGATTVLGTSDWAMRFPSAIFGALSIPVIYSLVRSIGRSLDLSVVRIASWTAALLLAIHPLHVFYCREARVYPLLLLLTMMLWLALRRALDDDELRSWVGVSLLLLTIAYLHYYSLFLFATAGLLVLCLAPDTRHRWRGIAAVTLPGLLFLPYVILTFPHLRGSGAAWSVEALYEIFPGDRSFFRVLEMGMIGADYPLYLRQIAVPSTAGWLRWTAITLQISFVILAILCFVRAGSSHRQRRDDLVFWLLAWLPPLLIPWAITHGIRAIFHPGRHDVYASWGLLLGVGVGLGFLADLGKNRRLMVTVAAVPIVGVLSLAAAGRLALLHAASPDSSARERAAWISPHLKPSEGTGTVVWALGIRRLLTERYIRLAKLDLDNVPISSFPASTDSHPGWADARVLVQDRPAILEEAERRVAGLDPSVEIVFVLTVGPPPSPNREPTAQTWINGALISALQHGGWQIDSRKSRPDLDLLAFVRDTRRPPNHS